MTPWVLALDTRSVRIMLAVIRAGVGVAVMACTWSWLLLPPGAAALLGAFAVYALATLEGVLRHRAP